MRVRIDAAEGEVELEAVVRWIVAGLAGLVIAWGVYLVSPYYALYRLGRAVEAGDVDEVARRVNLRALRYSLARQVGNELAAREPAGIAGVDAQVAAAAAFVLADPLLDSAAKPEGLIRLLRTSPTGDPTGTAFGSRSVGIEDLDDFLASSSWRGFRNVYVTLPPDEPRASRFRLQLRLGNGRWRLVSLELPPQVIRRIATDLRRRSKP
jgi:hypothetical protein